VKRLFLLALLAILPTAPIAAQNNQVKIRFSFEGEARARSTNAAEVGSILAVRSALRAWTDSVDVFLDQSFIDAAARGWFRSRGSERADYLVTVLGLPVLNGQQQPTGLTVYSLAVFEAKYGDWKYLTQRVGYDLGAQSAAATMLSGVQASINESRIHSR
jgi:hypothetical protein